MISAIYISMMIVRIIEEASSGCYLTTACVDAMEFPDDCLELQTMRRLRDEYILPNIENGRKIVEEYYAKAPQIVSAINAKRKQHRNMERHIFKTR